MAEMGLTPTDRWHLLGKHGCHHVDSAEFVETREFDELALTHPEWGSPGVPSEPGGPDARWCRHCEDTIDELRDRRYNTIGKLKTQVPYRDISWQTVDCAGDCPWCGKAKSATQYDDDLDETVCPACAWKYNNGPDVENPPETDLRQDKPTDTVDPIRYTYYTGNAERPPDEPAPSESLEQARQRAADEQRPYVEVKIKDKYADVVCDIAGTGYRFTPAAIEEIESLQAEQKDRTDADPDHKSYVTTDVGPRGTYVRTATLFPQDARSHADDLAAIAADPSNWQ
jgi:hypothetical protein